MASFSSFVQRSFFAGLVMFIACPIRSVPPFRVLIFTTSRSVSPSNALKPVWGPFFDAFFPSQSSLSPFHKLPFVGGGHFSFLFFFNSMLSRSSASQDSQTATPLRLHVPVWQQQVFTQPLLLLPAVFRPTCVAKIAPSSPPLFSSLPKPFPREKVLPPRALPLFPPSFPWYRV